MSDRTPQEQREQITALAKGDRGEQGNQGNRGERGVDGLSPRLRRSLFGLFCVAVILAVIAVVAVFHEQDSARTAQQKQGEMVEAKLCTTLGRLTELQPPPGNPVTNPSRAFDQKLHDTLSQLGPDLGCK